MKYYDRYGNLILKTNNIPLVKTDFSHLSSIYSDEGSTGMTFDNDSYYYYSDTFSEDTIVDVEIAGTPSTHDTYRAFYVYAGELISGGGDNTIVAYNVTRFTNTSIPSANWTANTKLTIKSGRRLVLLFYRPYTELLLVQAKKHEDENSVQEFADSIGSHIPVFSDVLSSELIDFTPLIYDFPMQTDEYIANPYNHLEINDEEFLGMYYDNWIGTHRDGFKITKKSIGYDQTGQYQMYEYDFRPKSYTYTILLTSGLHPYELSSTFGLAWFMQRYLQVIDGEIQDAGFEYLRKHVRIKSVPILNPWGFNQNPKTYGNVNGVNINRNVTFKWADGTDAWTHKPAQPDSEWEWKGTAPFSEQETKNIRDWVTENQDAIMWIDCHTDSRDSRYDVYALYRGTTDANNEYDVFTLGTRRARNALIEHMRTKYGIANPVDGSREGTWDAIVDGYGITNYGQMEYGIWQNTIEQSPARTTWGSSELNEGVDITEYAVSIYAFLFGALPHNVDAETWIRSLMN